MAYKPKKLDDKQLVSACQRRLDRASRFGESKLSRERKEIEGYYNGDYPVQTRDDDSSYVSLDVTNAVDAMTAQLLETFGAGSDIVTFKAQLAADTILARIATAYTEYQIFSLNNGLEIFSDVIHSGLKNRVSIAHVYWEPNVLETEHEVAGVPEEQWNELLNQPGIEPAGVPEMGMDEMTGQPTYSGKVKRTRNVGQVRIDPIPPEEFSVASRTKDLRRASYLNRRQILTLGDLVAAGHDPDIVYSIKGNGGDDLDMNQEAQARRNRTDDSFMTYMDEGEDEASREVTVDEDFIRIDKEGLGFQKIWHVIRVGDVLLKAEIVERLPFVLFRPIPLPFTFWGDCFAKRAIGAAKSKTQMMRGALNVTARASIPRFTVVKGALSNPRELVDPRPGGVVNINKAGAVEPLGQPPLPPQTFQVMQQADMDREDNTGISRLSQGLNKDAVSSQNSANMVEQLTTNSQVRQKIIARHFAMQFVKELYLEVYALCIENETDERIFEVAGEFVKVTPAEWAERKDVTVDMSLGYGDRERAANDLFALHKELSSDPSMARMYGEKRKYAVVKKALETRGWKDVNTFLDNPDDLPEPQQDPKVLAELEKLKKETEVMERKVAVHEQQFQFNAQLEQMKIGIQKQMDEMKLMLATRDEDRKDKLAEAKMDLDTAEFELTAANFASPDVERKATAILSPNA